MKLQSQLDIGAREHEAALDVQQRQLQQRVDGEQRKLHQKYQLDLEGKLAGNIYILQANGNTCGESIFRLYSIYVSSCFYHTELRNAQETKLAGYGGREQQQREQLESRTRAIEQSAAERCAVCVM